MTHDQIAAVSAGDSIIGAFGLDDELHVEHVGALYGGEREVYLRYSSTAVVPMRLTAGGPEILGVHV